MPLLGSTARTPTSSTGRRPRWGLAALVATLLAVVAAGLTQPVTSSASPLRAAHRKASVSLAVSAHTVLPHDTVRVRGHVSPAPAGTAVALQRHVSSGWTTLARTRTHASTGYLFEVHPTATHRYRVYAP